ncbi:MAG: type VI secretion system Vgr family protein [Paracoccaceae bacterium]
MFNTKPLEDTPAWMSGDFSFEAILQSATVTEQLGRITEMRVHFEVEQATAPKDYVGKVMRVHVETHPGRGRSFAGICVAVETRVDKDHTSVTADVRPWLWMLTRNKNTRIFQDMTVKEIITQVFSDASFSDYKLKLNGTYDKRVYCVQYRESDFDFITRLMEQEGIYYYFPSEPDALETFDMVICDDIGGHDPVPDYSRIDFNVSDTIGDGSDDQMFDWTQEQAVVSGKVSLDDYDFHAPTSDLMAVNIQNKGSHQYNKYELYDAPGKQQIDKMAPGKETDRGNHLARVQMEAHVVRYETWFGRTGVRMMGVGRLFTLYDHPSKPANQEYLVTSAVHTIESDARKEAGDAGARNAVYACNITAIPSSVPYRSMAVAPWPEVAGFHTAVVVGPSGEEIYTDEFGRIKVQFHWDRIGKKDEKSTCWVRVVTPWSGSKWGGIQIPRIGQEVMIQFEEGDPDRPICTGMLYNKDTMPPYALPDNKTQSGIKTLSSKGGNASTTYNEIMFEDKKDAELLRMQAQKDHEFLIKDMAKITIGHDAAKVAPSHEGFSISTVVKQNITEQITDGDKFRQIDKGSETIKIKKDKTQTVEGKHTKTITGNDTLTVKQGNLSETIKMGNMSTEVSMGNKKTEVKMGNISTKASLGAITMEAMQKIELKVGPSKITIDMSGVKIEGPMITVKGTAMTTVKAPMTTVKGDGMLTLKGGVTMIN